MLEGLVAWVLNNYLGKYVENLNTDQLSIALLSGEVELENLPLKKDALRNLGLPIEVKAGFIGKVKLQIPVTQVRSKPWVIIIEQLYVVASPLSIQEWDSVAEEHAAQERKLSNLDNLEARWRLETNNKEYNPTYYASTYSSWLSYGTGLITNIIENLQLKIKDVHIRYEDNASIPDKAVAFGITVDSLSAQSCNENWIPGFSHWDSSVSSYKLLEMQKLAAYWIDLEYDQLFMKMSLGELAVAMSPGQYSKHSQYYILAPVSAQAKVKRNRSEKPLRSHDTPRIVCDLQLEDVPLTLDNCQYQQMVECVKGLDDIARFRSYRYYRPTCSVKQDPTAWWLYAISCLYPGKQPQICRPRPTWESCLRYAKENVEYVRIYTKLIVFPNVALTPEDKKWKDQIEWDRTFEELKILRELAMKSVPAQNSPTNTNGSAGRSVLVRWFPQWMGWYSSSTTTTNSETTQLEGEILQALSETLEDNTVLKRDVVFGQFSFSLRNGSLNLSTVQEHNNERIPMIEFEFKNLCLSVTSSPRSSSHTIGLCLGAIYLKDKITPNTTFPVLVGPPGHERTPLTRSRGPSPRVSLASKPEDLFSLEYEKCAANSGCDYRLNVRSKCLDVVYQPMVIKWLVEFLLLPYQRAITHSSIEAMKTRTKKGLIKNWEQMLDGRVSVRKVWDVHLDISAPQIFFVEKFNDQNSYMAVLDFGRFQFSNIPLERTECVLAKGDSISRGTDDDDLFVTPCSTPPVSEESNSDSPLTALNVNQQMGDSLTEVNLHDKLYDRYTLELTDMQVLVGKVKDNWRYAHNKGTSTMHVLDRFNISLKIERRVVHTTDPLYPSLTVNANLPKLVAHFNESKISAARNLSQIISATGLPSPFSVTDSSTEDFISEWFDDDESTSVDTSVEMSRLLMLQFSIDHMALEVQSRGRSVAELQVSGVKVAFTKRPIDTSITLTVHSLLLVDALQTFGPDFELLVASHKHVGMDSMSGSLRDSEPTSPTSPGSPDPTLSRPQATSPVALKQALTSLAASPPLHHTYKATYNRDPSILDAEALISIEVILVTGSEPMQLANIQFNNLDIIANQETIVELMGFIRRVFPDLKSHQPPLNLQPTVPSSIVNSTDALDQIDSPKMGTTELTFDFHRLNVLLLRGIVKDGSVQGRKICTATMSEAKIQATVDNGIVVEGSLGGLQVMNLTPEGHVHQRIISVGKDPLLDATHPLYVMSQNVHEDEGKAFSFKFTRSFNSKEINNDDQAEIKVRMASLWYTHSPQFVGELQSCATEFKQYMANLARSIKSAATDMALGLVHARLSASIYGSALSFSDIASPRRRRRSNSIEQSFSGYSSVRDTIPQTPYSPEEDSDYVINIRLDVVLDTPVLVLPRANNSAQVFVGHLGKITLKNTKPHSTQDGYFDEAKVEHYDIEIKDMNIFSLDTSGRRVPGPLMSRPEILYCCDTLAKPILHDTILQLSIVREIYKTPSRTPSLPNILLDGINTSDNNNEVVRPCESIQVTGSVVTALKVSLARYQYEQLIDTVTWLMSTPSVAASHTNSGTMNKTPTELSDITEEDTGVPTLKMDPHVRAKLFPGVAGAKHHQEKSRLQVIKVLFELPNFIVELRGDSPMGEQGLVDLSFRDFCFVYEKCHVHETNIQVSLRSILMEDLLQPEGTKQRAMVVSSCDSDLPPGSSCISRSCPNISDNLYMSNTIRGSLPTNLQPGKLLGGDHMPSMDMYNQSEHHDYPCTPPPSPTRKSRVHKNLVLISTLIVNPNAPNFKTYYNSVERSTSVDFNCLDLVINVESWVLVIDFFSVVPTNSAQSSKPTVVKQHSQDIIEDRHVQYTSETNVSVRSLTMVLVRPDRDLAKANISRVKLSVKGNRLRNEIQGELGSMSLIDLTLHGQLYRERFLTSGKQALNFTYISFGPNERKEYDAQFKLEMSSVLYIHTKRFVAELIAFFNHFTQLQAVMTGIRVATSGQQTKDETFRLSLIIEAASPVMLLPVSSKSTDLLICNFGQLNINNTFKLSDDIGTISVMIEKPTDKKCLLDVMYLELQNVDLYTGIYERDINHPTVKRSSNCSEVIRLGSCSVRKNGSSILTEPCHLKLQVERNLDVAICHNVPNMSIHGELSTLDGSLNESQYKLIRGFLDYNLGENTEHILPSVQPPPISAEPNIREMWTLNSIRLDLLNVTIRLNNTAPLACINFIKSRLTIETFSNFSQDIDLVSQEILIKDTRFDDVPVDKRSNVFTNILQPLKSSSKRNVVQAEIHSRKRLNRSKSTVLLNNMRLMAVFDWWEAAREFIFQNINDVTQSPMHDTAAMKSSKTEEDTNFEFKLNVTDSELVVVEDTSLYDTNAVILKSTTVISYKPSMSDKPMSCNLNNCEMFSCILGMEDETALSIIDPVTLNIEINKERALEILLQRLTIRVSYYDMKMFIQILNSLPKQMFSGKKTEEPLPPNLQNQVDKLAVLGFATEDCLFALERNNKKIDDAALWLTQNAIPRNSHDHAAETSNQKIFDLAAVEVKADCICLNIIDDCGDADVPLLELSLSNLNLRQCLTPVISNDSSNSSQGALECTLTSDYYNRVLSGWEPVIEPWNCILMWNQSLTSNLSRNRLQMRIDSKEVLNLNITSTLIELYKQVRDNWMQDFYSSTKEHTQTSHKSQNNSSGFRRRSPFVPFAIKNETGSLLKFTTMTSELDELCEHKSGKKEHKWHNVEHGNTVPFSFKSRGKIRHSDSHKMRVHRLGVQVDGYETVTLVTIDKVGVYFRTAVPSVQSKKQLDLPPARIVFDVALEGSARKLVTVRSALMVVNKLKDDMEIKLESKMRMQQGNQWTVGSNFILRSNSALPVPLLYAHFSISARPTNQIYTFSSQIQWENVTKPGDILHELRSCQTHRGQVYRFCSESKRENYPPDRPSAIAGVVGQYTQPGHTITLLPTVLLVNLLPVDIIFKMTGGNGRVSGGNKTAITFVDTEQDVELKIYLENYQNSTTIRIPFNCVRTTFRLKLEDNLRRKLNLTVNISPHSEAKLKVTVSAPYWIINKTGLPLVFKQGGVSNEASGQFTEHESARMVAPLLFSFSDPDASPTVVARVGSNVIPDSTAQWCSNFHLQRGCQVRQLKVSMKDGRPDIVFLIGIEVRSGRGKYRNTNIVIISPRFQLHNKTSYQLLFAQSCGKRDVSDPKQSKPLKTYLKAMPDCHMPFHWTHFDQEQLLCVLILNVSDCWWSGGLKIDKTDSMHVNIRDANGRMYFLRLEIVLQGATFFVVFTDADTMPPPLRVDNFSEVSIVFSQTCCKDIVHSIARAHSSVPYAWDKSTKSQMITLEAPGGVVHSYDMKEFGPGRGLTYENFIYIAFSGTFKKCSGKSDPFDIESQELVLDVINKTQVVLARKQQGQRSQLWRMTTTGQLQHEGSSPPSYPQQPKSENVYVLDIEGFAPQPSSYTRLCLRRPDPRRKSTQTWRFTEEGRLCCIHNNMCVQAQDGFYGLRQGNAAVLGLPQAICHRTNEAGVPLEQAVCRQRLRPGSGFLDVEISTDGPTRVISIWDKKDKNRKYAMSDENDWINIVPKQRPYLLKGVEDNDKKENKEYQFTLRLKGLGVSVISKYQAQELLFAYFSNINGETLLTSTSKRFCISVEDIQIDNQLFDTPTPIFLHVTKPSSRSTKDAQDSMPALDITAELQPILNENAVIFKYFIMTLKKLTIHLEERLLLKLFAFIGFNSQEEILYNTDETDYEAQKVLIDVSAAHARRYYFGLIQLQPSQIRLSMKTATKLSPHLQSIKKKLGFTFIKFEDAAIDVEPFRRDHPFETLQFLVNSIIKHFKDELKWQAAVILGSVDFLGNPLGFMNDVSEGVNGLLREGNVGALVTNLAHGLSNSAAKVTETISDGLGLVAMDDEHEEMRQRIRQVDSGRSRDHLYAGLKGLGFGVLGGATGIFKQVYDGATNEGIQGIFSGIGKGLVGAVAKPVVGVLDLASETARAVRDSSRGSSRKLPDRIRPPRCVSGIGDLLPKYSCKQAMGQQYLHTLNDRNYGEQLVAYENLRLDSDDLHIIISNERVRIVTNLNGPNLTTIIVCHLSDLEKCRTVSEENKHYIEITMHVQSNNTALVYQDPVKKPRVRCESQELAASVLQQLNYAKRLYDERLHTLQIDNILNCED